MVCIVSGLRTLSITYAVCSLPWRAFKVTVTCWYVTLFIFYYISDVLATDYNMTNMQRPSGQYWMFTIAMVNLPIFMESKITSIGRNKKVRQSIRWFL